MRFVLLASQQAIAERVPVLAVPLQPAPQVPAKPATMFLCAP